MSSPPTSSTFGRSVCPPEDGRATLAALELLQGPARHFYVRCYRHYGPGADGYGNAVTPTPPDPSRYLGNGRRIDLVCCYQATKPDPNGFAAFVRSAVRDIHAWGGGKLQVGEELNMPAPLDGGSPGCFEAVAAGLCAAVQERARIGADVLIGVNAAGMADCQFWTALAEHLETRIADVDYLGLDMFPDVFRPIPQPELADAVLFLLQTARERSTAAGFPAHLPFHITETGWPTGPERGEDQQAEILALVADTVRTSGHDIAAYEIFGLRDTLTSGGWQHRFGILRDDYTPKPAFARLAALIADMS